MPISVRSSRKLWQAAVGAAATKEKTLRISGGITALVKAGRFCSLMEKTL